MTGGSISDFQKNATVFNHADLDVSGVTITGGGAQTIIAQNGIQALNSTGTIAGNTINDIGYAGPADAYSGGILVFDNTGLAVTGQHHHRRRTTTTPTPRSSASTCSAVPATSAAARSAATRSPTSTPASASTAASRPTASLIDDNTVTDLDATDPYAAGLDHEPDAGLATVFNVEGTDQNDIFSGGTAADTFTGLDGDDLYLADGSDNIVEAADEGIDAVRTYDSFVLPDNVENLTLLGGSGGSAYVEDFESFAIGAIADGENGWTFLGGGKDQEVIVDPDNALNQVFRMSSDPSIPDFSGPLSPALLETAGEVDDHGRPQLDLHVVHLQGVRARR